jgi:hypothetical protein
VGWLCYGGNRLQATQLKNWVSVPGRGDTSHLDKASRLSYHVGSGGLFAVLGKVWCMFLCMYVRFVCVCVFQKEFKNLKNLDLFNNEATSIDNYREKVFHMIPSLKYLDG